MKILPSGITTGSINFFKQPTLIVSVHTNNYINIVNGHGAGSGFSIQCSIKSITQTEIWVERV